MIFHDNENKNLMTITSLFIQSLFQIMPNANIIVPYSLLNKNNKNSFIDIFCLLFFKCLNMDVCLKTPLYHILFF